MSKLITSLYFVRTVSFRLSEFKGNSPKTDLGNILVSLDGICKRAFSGNLCFILYITPINLDMILLFTALM